MEGIKRKRDIHPKIQSKNDIMFGNTIALGDDCYTLGMPLEDDHDINVENEECSLPSEDMRSEASTLSQSTKSVGKRNTRNSDVARLNDKFAKFLKVVQQRTEI